MTDDEVDADRAHAAGGERAEDVDEDTKTVADWFDLDDADVYRALVYYHDHPREMKEVERKREKSLERVQEQTGRDDANLAADRTEALADEENLKDIDDLIDDLPDGIGRYEPDEIADENPYPDAL
ncbi:hypothetical protein [Natrinema sp. 1APR25-10V2]|uniref:hypothetical protein n=1 Tax=Natrinema sp. 1APR25-10V2 TaxID=2951081 RepID=UPI002876DC21|nr:hypothetical protein [Natrinema sp. 1APR25-10V2]MDS0473523.1 hypothetical protein [Natrinema sp. 1APR25-10V2]